MKIKMACMQNSLVAHGFRKLTAMTAQLNPDTTIYFISQTGNTRSIIRLLLAKYDTDFSPELVQEIAEGLADADLIAFSAMSYSASLTKAVMRRIKELHPQAYIIWGGIHPIVAPEDAIDSAADAICTGEGQFAFQEFLERFQKGQDVTQVKNFWFQSKKGLIRNGFRPLMTSAEMDDLPLPSYAEEHEMIYKPGKGFRAIKKIDYLNSNALAYPTIWSLGCPFRCTYCSNAKFIENDPRYRRLRYPHPRYIIEEIKAARCKHPHIQTVIFGDDSFTAIKLETLEEFARLWQEEVQLNFGIFGIHPNHVRYDKLEVLTQAGLNRTRMGIQSGSKRLLQLYGRPTSIAKIEQAVHTVSQFSTSHITPAYDFIVDNPLETKADLLETLELLYRLPRPYFLNTYSLRALPYTQLAKDFESQGIEVEGADRSLYKVRPSLNNTAYFILCVFKPPRWLFQHLLSRVQPASQPQKNSLFLYYLFRFLFLAKQGLSHLSHMDFSVMVGRKGYLAWRLGLTGLWNKSINPKRHRLKQARRVKAKE